MRRRQLLTLIENHGVSDPQAADQLLTRVVREAQSLNVPLTAVTGTFLIQVFNTEPDRVLVNQATLIERYVELLLQRFTRPDIELKSFDFRLKRDLLSVIAGRMADQDDYAPSYNLVLEWVLDYVKLYGFAQDAPGILDHFIGCKIFERFSGPDGDHVRFPLTAFLSYFLAWRMIQSKEFRDWVLDSERYLSYPDEVSFYAALVRNDEEAIQLVFKTLEGLTSEMWVDASEEVKSGAFIDDYIEPNSEASEDEVFAIQEVVRSNEETDRERKNLLDDSVGELEPTQRVNRPDFQTVGERWFAHLALASNILKHMELIPDTQKRALLSGLMTNWLQFTALSLSLVPQIARDRSVTINGVLYKLNLRVEAPIGELTRRVSLAMPAAVSQVATGLLGSEKLKLQLSDGVGGDTLRPSEQLLRALILADIGVDDIADVLRDAADGVKGHRYLLNVLARKVYDVAVRYRLNGGDVDRLRALASDIFVRLEGKPPAVTQVRRNQLIRAMRDQRRVMEIVSRDDL